MNDNNNPQNYDIINQLKREMDTIGSRINKLGNASPQAQRYQSQNQPHQFIQKPARTSYTSPNYPPHGQPQAPIGNFASNTLQPRNMPFNTPQMPMSFKGPGRMSTSPKPVKKKFLPPGVPYGQPGPKGIPIKGQMPPMGHIPAPGHHVIIPPGGRPVPRPHAQSIPQQSITKKDGNFQEVLFETIEEFDQKRKMYGDNSDLKSIGKLLLPLDVFLLYSEQSEISQEFSEKIKREKAIVDGDIDNFLKEIILMMEKVKEKLHHKIDFYHQGFYDYYGSFMKRVDEFLKGSINMITGSESMQNYQDMRKSLNENDPLSKEIGIFRKKKEQATQIEKLFRNVKENYRGTKLGEMTKVIDSILSQEVTTYNKPNGEVFFKNHQADFGAKVMNDRKLSDETLIKSFKVELGRETERPKAPVQNIHRLRDPSPISKPKKKEGHRVHFMDGSEADEVSLRRKLPSKPKHQAPTQNIPVPKGHPSEAQVSPNNSEIILKYNPKSPSVQKLKDFKLPLHSSKITCIEALDSRVLALGQKDGTLMLLDLEKNPDVENFVIKKLNLKDQINCILPPVERQSSNLAPPLTELYCAMSNSTIAVLNFSNGGNATVSRLSGHTGGVNKIIHYTPNLLFSCSDDGCVGLWDMKTHRALALTRIHSSKVNSICLMNSKKILLSAGQDCKIGVFQIDKETGKISMITELKDYYPIKYINSFHNNTNFAVAASDDGMIKVWNIDRKECLNVIQGHSSEVLGLVIVTCLTQSPDIFFLSFAKGEPFMRYGDVDSQQNNEIVSKAKLNCQYEKEGASMIQVLSGTSKGGFRYCMVEQDEFGGVRSISVWSLR